MLLFVGCSSSSRVFVFELPDRYNINHDNLFTLFMCIFPAVFSDQVSIQTEARRKVEGQLQV